MAKAEGSKDMQNGDISLPSHFLYSLVALDASASFKNERMRFMYNSRFLHLFSYFHYLNFLF